MINAATISSVASEHHKDKASTSRNARKNWYEQMNLINKKEHGWPDWSQGSAITKLPLLFFKTESNKFVLCYTTAIPYFPLCSEKPKAKIIFRVALFIILIFQVNG